MPYDTTIREKVDEYVSKHALFTSVDIANAIKKDGVWIRNRYVRDWLRSNIESDPLLDEYTTAPIRCNGSRATLYLPLLANPDDYKERDQRPLTPDEVKKIQKDLLGKPNDQAVPDIQDVLSTKESQDHVMSKVITSRERIKIPGEMIRALGWRPGQEVDRATIKTHKVMPFNLKVNSDCRVSIPRSCVNWPGHDIKVILKDKTIIFEKAS